MGRYSKAELERLKNPIVNTVKIVEIVNEARPVKFGEYPNKEHANKVLDKLIASGVGQRVGKDKISRSTGYGKQVLEIQAL